MDNCFSLFSHKFYRSFHQYSYNQKMLVEYFKLHEDLMKFWFKDSDKDIFVLYNQEFLNNKKNF